MVCSVGSAVGHLRMPHCSRNEVTSPHPLPPPPLPSLPSLQTDEGHTPVQWEPAGLADACTEQPPLPAGPEEVPGGGDVHQAGGQADQPHHSGPGEREGRGGEEVKTTSGVYIYLSQALFL